MRRAAARQFSGAGQRRRAGRERQRRTEKGALRAGGECVDELAHATLPLVVFVLQAQDSQRKGSLDSLHKTATDDGELS